MNPRSRALFHFTKSFDTLKAILSTGFWPQYCSENLDWTVGREFYMPRRYAFPMVCFCDIPLSRTPAHRGRFGNYAIGMTREWTDRNPISPVLYVAPEKNFTNTVLDVMRMGPPTSDAVAYPLYSANTVVMHSFIKPTRGHDYLPDGSLTDLIDYYQESEWRFGPVDGRIPRDGPAGGIALEEFRRLHHPVTRQHSMLRFEAQDIQHIIVSRENEIESIIDFLCDHFSNCSSAVGRRLLTKIKSFQSIDDDH